MTQGVWRKLLLRFTCHSVETEYSSASAATIEQPCNVRNCSSNGPGFHGADCPARLLPDAQEAPDSELLEIRHYESSRCRARECASRVDFASASPTPTPYWDPDSAYQAKAAQLCMVADACLPPTSLTELAGVRPVAQRRESILTDSTKSACLEIQMRFSQLYEMRAQVEQLQMLGRGGQAVVLRGVWQLAEVAVKLVIANPASVSSSTFSKLLLEGPLSKCLRAPNVVETYCYTCRQLTAEDLLEARQPIADVSTSTNAQTSCGGGYDDACLASLNYTSGLWMGYEGVIIGQHGDCMRSFDSHDGFGSPNHRRSTGAVLSYSEALSIAGAAPGCFLTQIIMEYCDKGSLAEAVARGAYGNAAHDRMALFAYLRTLYDIAAGMSYLHSNGVIHGDLKPGNVLLRSSRTDSRGYQAKIADFGLSHCAATAKGAPNADDDWSSYSYMAPEHFDGAMVMASDVWSFAATAHHMWTGVLPHADLQPVQVCMGVCDGSLRLEAPAHMPAQLAALLQACMAHEWQQRPGFVQIRAAIKDLETAFCGV